MFLCKIAISILYRCLFRNPACFLVSFLWQLNPCKGKLEQLRESLEVPAPELPKPGISLGNWLDHWYQTYKRASLRPNTQMSYERWIYQHIIHALGSIQLDKLTAGNIQQSYTHLKQNSRLLRRELYGEVSLTRPSAASTPPSTRPWTRR